MYLDTVHRHRLYCKHGWLATWHYFRGNIAASPISSWPGSTWFLPVPLPEISAEGTALLCLLLIALRMRRKSWKGFHKMASRNGSNTFTAASRSEQLHKETILRHCSLNRCTVLYFSEVIPEYFEATIHIPCSLVLYIKGISRFPLFHSDPLISKLSILNYAILVLSFILHRIYRLTRCYKW